LVEQVPFKDKVAGSKPAGRTVERADFEKLAEEGYGQLPSWVREKIVNVAILVEDEPSEEVRAAEGLGEDEMLLGLYEGVPRTARSYDESLVLPDRITLYQFPIEAEAAETGLPVAQVIAETIWHESAHHFGMDEDAVRAREEERDNSN
jgi:predicted Zn-dependent protease with MMP-like domain